MTDHTHIHHKTWLTLSLTLGLVLCGFASWRAGARESSQSLRERHSLPSEQAGKGQALAGVLNVDGTVRPGMAGSFDASGYRMEYTATGAPRFAPKTAESDDKWDGQFGVPGVDGSVYAIAISGSDIYVGGTFTVASNIFANRIAKWDGGHWTALGNGVNDAVTAIAISGNDVYVGGEFGSPANRVAKWDGANWSSLGSGVNDYVSALAVSGGDLYVGGSFTMAGGNPANRVAKWNGNNWLPLGSGVEDGFPDSNDERVRSLAVSGNNLYVGGYFTIAGGNPVKHIARWDGNSWSSLGVGPLNGANYSSCIALAVNGNELYAALVILINFRPNSVIWKWNGSSWSMVAGGLSGEVYVIASIGSDLYIGGFFSTTATGSSVVSGMAKWNDNSWVSVGNGAGGPVLAIAISGGNLYAGGGLQMGGGNRARGIAKWDGSNWSALGDGNGLASYDSYVNAFAVNGNDLYVGGFDSMIGSSVAKWSNSGWVALGNGPSISVNTLAVGIGDLYAGGNFSNDIARWNGISWSTFGSSTDSFGQISALFVNGSDLYAGGSFLMVGGISANSVAKWNGSSWSPLSSGVTHRNFLGAVRAFAAIGSDLYVGGSFTSAGGNPANLVAKWNGNSWLALGSGVGVLNAPNQAVNALAVIGTDLYVGGRFPTAGGNLSANIAKWDGNSWSALGSGVNGIVTSLAVIGNDLYVGGSFTQAGGQPAKHLAKWDGKSWSPLGSGINGSVNALAGVGGNLYVGGVFTSAGNKPSFNLARYLNNTPPIIAAIAGILRQQDTTANPLQLATVNDVEDTPNILTVTVNGASTATVNGVTISNISADAIGKVTANISTAANATNATFTLRVTDSGGAFAEAPLTITVVRVAAALSDPLICTGPGNMVAVTVTIGNPNSGPLTATLMTTFTNLIGVPGSCNQPNCTVASIGLSYSATLAPSQTVVLNYLARVADGVAPGAQLCANNMLTFNGGQPLTVTACNTVNCPSAGPGTLAATTSLLNAQRPGSILIYNVFTSSAAASNQQNTRLSLTNTHPLLKSYVHLFFVDGASCSVADGFVCLTPNQTTSFLASDLDPGTSGYVIAVAVDALGCPVSFNHLIGDEFVKFSSGHTANLGAEAVTAIAGGLPFCDGNTTTAELRFDGSSYSVLPTVLAADNLSSRADGNDTLLILNRIGGSLATGAGTLGSVFGILYDDAEAPVSFSFAAGTCQLRSVLSSSFPRTVPRYETFIPAGRTGWLKVSATNLGAMTGAVLNFNPNAAAQGGAFNQGHNLHKLTTTNTVAVTIPVFPPGC